MVDAPGPQQAATVNVFTKVVVAKARVTDAGLRKDEVAVAAEARAVTLRRRTVIQTSADSADTDASSVTFTSSRRDTD